MVVDPVIPIVSNDTIDLKMTNVEKIAKLEEQNIDEN